MGCNVTGVVSGHIRSERNMSVGRLHARFVPNDMVNLCERLTFFMEKII